MTKSTRSRIDKLLGDIRRLEWQFRVHGENPPSPIGQGINFALSDFIGVILDFVVAAVVVFFVAKYGRKLGVK